MLVEFEIDRGEVVKFVVKLEIDIDGLWVEVERYDCYHGSVHKDILDSSLEKVRVISFDFLDPAAGLNTAIRDFQENFPRYVGRSDYGNRA